jgi:hypothetical protein
MIRSLSSGQITSYTLRSYTTVSTQEKGSDQMNNYSSMMTSWYDPYVYQTLQTLKGKQIAVQTVRGSVRGQLIHVRPDHLVIRVSGTPFFIRTQQIVWVVPTRCPSTEKQYPMYQTKVE